MNDFAKLFETEFGQILVIIESNDKDCPEIKILFKPDRMGVCKITLQEFDDDSWDVAEKGFEHITQEVAANIVKKIINHLDADTLFEVNR